MLGLGFGLGVGGGGGGGRSIRALLTWLYEFDVQQNLDTPGGTPAITFTRPSLSNEQNADGSLTQVGSGVARVTDLGLELEPAATALNTYPIDLTNTAQWAVTNCTSAIGSEIDSLGGLMTTVTATAAGNRLAATGSGINTSSDTTYTYQWEVRAGSSSFVGVSLAGVGTTAVNGGVIFSLSGAGSVVSTTGTIDSASITLLQSGLYQITVVQTTGAAQTSVQCGVGVSDGSTYASTFYPSATSGTIHANVMNMTQSGYATSPITWGNGSVATRDQDVASFPVPDLSAIGFTLFIHTDISRFKDFAALVSLGSAGDPRLGTADLDRINFYDAATSFYGPTGTIVGEHKFAVSMSADGTLYIARDGVVSSDAGASFINITTTWYLALFQRTLESYAGSVIIKGLGMTYRPLSAADLKRLTA